MNKYQERRLQELREMTTEEAARCKIRSSTPSRVKAVILRARRKMADWNDGEEKLHTSPSKTLKDGDVLLKRSSGSMTNKIITGVTRSPYTHAALCTDGKVYDTLGKAGSAEREVVKLGGNINTVDDFIKREKGF